MANNDMFNFCIRCCGHQDECNDCSWEETNNRLRDEDIL